MRLNWNTKFKMNGRRAGLRASAAAHDEDLAEDETTLRMKVLLRGINTMEKRAAELGRAQLGRTGATPNHAALHVCHVSVSHVQWCHMQGSGRARS